MGEVLFNEKSGCWAEPKQLISAVTTASEAAASDLNTVKSPKMLSSTQRAVYTSTLITTKHFLWE